MTPTPRAVRCGCEIVGKLDAIGVARGTHTLKQETLRIKYCPLHANAYEMLMTLKGIADHPEMLGFEGIKKVCLKAITTASEGSK